MSAEVRPVYVAYCAACNKGFGPEDDEDDVDEWAAEHDAEYHDEPDRDDADRDNYLESLRNL